MITNKISALEALKVNLEDCNSRYEWTEQWNCNAGKLVQCVNNVNSDDLRRQIVGNKVSDGFWGSGFHSVAICEVSGLPMSKVYSKLRELGFTVKEIDSLERLSDEKVASKLGWVKNKLNDINPYNRRDEKEHVIAYVSAWIEILKESETPQETIKYVVIDKEIRSEVKEAIK